MYKSFDVRFRKPVTTSVLSTASQVGWSSPHSLRTCGFVRIMPGISRYSARTSSSESTFSASLGSMASLHNLLELEAPAESRSLTREVIHERKHRRYQHIPEIETHRPPPADRKMRSLVRDSS